MIRKSVARVLCIFVAACCAACSPPVEPPPDDRPLHRTRLRRPVIGRRRFRDFPCSVLGARACPRESGDVEADGLAKGAKKRPHPALRATFSREREKGLWGFFDAGEDLRGFFDAGEGSVGVLREAGVGLSGFVGMQEKGRTTPPFPVQREKEE